MIYKINDMMFLNSRNIMILWSLKKLNDKMLKFFKILIKIEHAYQLKLSLTMKIHSEFASNLLQLDSKNSLNEQRNESFDFIVIDDEDEWRWRIYWTSNTTNEINDYNIMLIKKNMMSIYIDTTSMKVNLKNAWKS